MIGVSRNCTAYAGVVGLPYQKDGSSIIFRPYAHVGLVSQSKAFTTDYKECNHLLIPKMGSPLHFVISKARISGPLVDRIVEEHKGRLSYVGGAGKRVRQM